MREPRKKLVTYKIKYKISERISFSDIYKIEETDFRVKNFYTIG